MPGSLQPAAIRWSTANPWEPKIEQTRANERVTLLGIIMPPSTSIWVQDKEYMNVLDGSNFPKNKAPKPGGDGALELQRLAT